MIDSALHPAPDPLPQRSLLRVVLGYASVASLWILLSDSAMEWLLPDPVQRTAIGLVKGWFFVGLTSGLLWWWLQRLAARANRLYTQRMEVLEVLDRIAQSSDDAVFAKDLDGRYLLFNESAARLVGRPVNEVMGQDDHALFPPAQADMLKAIGQRVTATGRTETIEEVLDTVLGRRTFLATKGPLRNHRGEVFGLFGISRDITAQRQAEDRLRQREHLLAALIGHSPSTLSFKHLDGRYAVANPNLQRLHHRTEAEIVGNTDADLYPADMARTYRANDLRVAAALTRLSIEEMVPVDGQMRRFMSHIFPVIAPDGTVEFIGRISLDITDSRRHEEALQARNEELERFNRAMVGREMDMVELKRELHRLRGTSAATATATATTTTDSTT